MCCMDYSSSSEGQPGTPLPAFEAGVGWYPVEDPPQRALRPDASTQEYPLRREDSDEALPVPWPPPAHSLPCHGAPDRLTSSKCSPLNKQHGEFLSS